MNCACGKWPHVYCAEDSVVDYFGNNFYCLYCINGLIYIVNEMDQVDNLQLYHMHTFIAKCIVICLAST